MQDYTEMGRTLLAKSVYIWIRHTIQNPGGTYDKVMIYADTINKFDKDTAQELKYVAMSRAKSNVYVVTSHLYKEQVNPPVITKPTNTSAEEWSKKEGWSVEYYNKNVLPKINEAWQIEYRLADDQNIKPRFKRYYVF